MRERDFEATRKPGSMRYLRLIIAMAGLALALIFPGSAAALFLDIQVGPTAQLVAKGAAVDVSVTVTCDATGAADVSVFVSQRYGTHVAQGSGFTTVSCTGSAQTLVVRVPASNSDSPFKRNQRTVATAELFGCDATECRTVTDSEVIEIVK
jgi:hypothetical protein